MNKWQMSNATVQSRQPGYMIDNNDHVHYSIHPRKGKQAMLEAQLVANAQAEQRRGKNYVGK